MINPKPLKSPNLLQKLFDKPNEANAIIEVNNFLAQQKGNFVSVDQILKILEKYDINLYKWEKNKKAELFELFYLYNLQDKRFSNEESDELRILKRIISLDDETIREIQAKVIVDIYEKSIEEVLEDTRITEQERSYIEEVRDKLGISKNSGQELFKEKAEKLLEQVVSILTEDRRLNPNEEKLAIELSKNYGVPIKKVKNFNDLLRYKLFWKIENGQIPIIKTDLKLTKGEVCHHINYIIWFEERIVTARNNELTSSNRVDLVRNNYSNPRENRIEKKKKLVEIRSGKIYLTNKRLIYKMPEGFLGIRLDEIGNFKVYKDGIDIYFTNGKWAFWEINKNLDLFSIILSESIKGFSIH